MAGRKKKVRYSEETPGFLKYYIGWIEIGNCDQKIKYLKYHDLHLQYHLLQSTNLIRDSFEKIQIYQ